MANLEIIKNLYDQESFWSICNPCMCNGYCCIGADISAYKTEWKRIKEYVKLLQDEEKLLLSKNITNGIQCIFRTNDKCLIHNVRPENCRYTPYQALIDNNNNLIYSMVKVNTNSKKCEFKRTSIKVGKKEINILEQNAIIMLPNYDIFTKYLSLNWVATQGILELSPCLTFSEWLKVDFLF